MLSGNLSKSYLKYICMTCCSSSVSCGPFECCQIGQGKRAVTTKYHFETSKITTQKFKTHFHEAESCYQTSNLPVLWISLWENLIVGKRTRKKRIPFRRRFSLVSNISLTSSSSASALRFLDPLAPLPPFLPLPAFPLRFLVNSSPNALCIPMGPKELFLVSNVCILASSPSSASLLCSLLSASKKSLFENVRRK